ncbi:hypothetical protein LTS14_007286 [Recurvomyces mirabilis]|nr:hypothetical protein LTS14_007286 [Recurvomyces mirabilis]
MTTPAPTAPKRTKSELLPAAKPPCKIYSTAIISEKAQVTGTYPVTIGENVVLHPYARIRAEGGSVSIGKGSIVYENAVVGTSKSDGDGGGDVEVGEFVTIETGAVVEAKSVGMGTEVGVKVLIGRGVVVGEWCKLTALEKVEAGKVLEDYTVVFGDGRERIDTTIKEHGAVRQARIEGMEKAVGVFGKLIPNGAAKWAANADGFEGLDGDKWRHTGSSRISCLMHGSMIMMIWLRITYSVIALSLRIHDSPRHLTAAPTTHANALDWTFFWLFPPESSMLPIVRDTVPLSH